MDIQPQDPSKKHFVVSMIKSVFRIGACYPLAKGDLLLAASLLAIAEALGIYEEIV